MSTALVTGATGFVGSNLVAALAERGWRVRVLLRSTSSRAALEGLAYEEVLGDVLDAESVARAMAGVERVFHVAAVAHYWRTSAAHMYRVNVEGTRIVMAAALRAGVARVVHCSSCAALGVPERGRPADESHAFNIAPERFHYGHSKLLAEAEVQHAVAAGLPAVIVNPCVILGPRDVNFISGSLLKEGQRGLLRVLPPGGMSIVHVDDVVAGHLAAAELGVPGERYILAGESLTHWEVGQIVCRTVGVRPPLAIIPGFVLPAAAAAASAFERLAGPRLPINSDQLRLSAENMYYDGTKARKAFGLDPKPASEAIEDAYRWYHAHSIL